MRTLVPFCNSYFLPFNIDVRLVIITIFSILFFNELASANQLNNHNTGLIGENDGDYVIIELDAISIADYEILIDGKNYKGEMLPYRTKQIHVYNLAELRNGTFHIHNFELDGQIINGTFNNINEWVTYLNNHSISNWEWDEARGILFGGEYSVQSSKMVVSTIETSGKMVSFSPVKTSITKNVMIKIPEGNHSVTVNHFVSGYSETKEIRISKEMAVRS